jgi:hypothetical protein
MPPRLLDMGRRQPELGKLGASCKQSISELFVAVLSYLKQPEQRSNEMHRGNDMFPPLLIFASIAQQTCPRPPFPAPRKTRTVSSEVRWKLSIRKSTDFGYRFRSDQVSRAG